MSGEQVADAMYTMAHRHLRANDVLYRVFYYDCAPMSKKMHNPVTKKLSLAVRLVTSSRTR